MGDESRGDLPEWQSGADATADDAPAPSDRRSTIFALASLIIGLAIVAGIAALALTGGDEAPNRGTTTEPIDAPNGDTDTDTDETGAGDTGAGVESSTTVPAEDDATAVRAAENTGAADEYGHWIGRNLMTASSVELAWSAIDGDDVAYRIHRFDRVAGFDPDVAPFADGVLIYDGAETDVIDDGVETDRFYTYVLDATVDGVALPRRWTEALTVDDTEPPKAISGLQAEVTADGVVLSWNRSSDNVEFAAYSVSLVSDGTGEPTYIGGGGDIEQTSFLDNRPPSGSVTYSVMAVDFHDNRTEPATVTVVVP